MSMNVLKDSTIVQTWETEFAVIQMEVLNVYVKLATLIVEEIVYVKVSA